MLEFEGEILVRLGHLTVVHGRKNVMARQKEVMKINFADKEPAGHFLKLFAAVFGW